MIQLATEMYINISQNSKYIHKGLNASLDNSNFRSHIFFLHYTEDLSTPFQETNGKLYKQRNIHYR